MTRRDFEMIARIVRNAKSTLAPEQHAALARQFCDALAGTSGGFRADIFMKACDVDHFHVGVGKCFVCGHFGADCTGKRRAS